MSPHVIGEGDSLDVTADLSQCDLKRTEIIDVRDPLPTAVAAFTGGPGVVPFDRAVDFPVGEEEINFHSRLLVRAEKLSDAFLDQRNTVLDGERTTKISAE